MSTPVRNENGWVWIKDVDVAAAAQALHEHKTHVGLTCDAQHGVYILFYDATRCEVVTGAGRGGFSVIYNYGDEPEESTAYVAAQVFELVRRLSRPVMDRNAL